MQRAHTYSNIDVGIFLLRCFYINTFCIMAFSFVRLILFLLLYLKLKSQELTTNYILISQKGTLCNKYIVKQTNAKINISVSSISHVLYFLSYAVSSRSFFIFIFVLSSVSCGYGCISSTLILDTARGPISYYSRFTVLLVKV